MRIQAAINLNYLLNLHHHLFQPNQNIEHQIRNSYQLMEIIIHRKCKHTMGLMSMKYEEFIPSTDSKLLLFCFSRIYLSQVPNDRLKIRRNSSKQVLLILDQNLNVCAHPIIRKSFKFHFSTTI